MISRVIAVTVLLAAGCDLSGPAATGTVEGVVGDQDHTIMRDVQIELSRTGKTTLITTSNFGGSFTFSNVETGTWQIRAVPPAGYTAPAPKSITVNEQRHVAVGIFLTKTSP